MIAKNVLIHEENFPLFRLRGTSFVYKGSISGVNLQPSELEFVL